MRKGLQSLQPLPFFVALKLPVSLRPTALRRAALRAGAQRLEGTGHAAAIHVAAVGPVDHGAWIRAGEHRRTEGLHLIRRHPGWLFAPLLMLSPTTRARPAF